jgi:histidyl-tRNA synthetase
MKQADRVGARTVLVVGDAELVAGQVLVRHMASGQQEVVDLGELEPGVGAVLGRKEG